MGRAKVKARRVANVVLLREKERRVARDLRVLSLMMKKKKMSRRTTTPLLMPLRTSPPRVRSLKKERNPLNPRMVKRSLRARSQLRRRVRTPRRNPAKVRKVAKAPAARRVAVKVEKARAPEVRSLLRRRKKP